MPHHIKSAENLITFKEVIKSKMRHNMNAQFAKVTFSIHLLQRRTLRTAKNYKETGKLASLTEMDQTHLSFILEDNKTYSTKRLDEVFLGSFVQFS